jgi:hypothetical protein
MLNFKVVDSPYRWYIVCCGCWLASLLFSDDNQHMHSNFRHAPFYTTPPPPTHAHFSRRENARCHNLLQASPVLCVGANQVGYSLPFFIGIQKLICLGIFILLLLYLLHSDLKQGASLLCSFECFHPSEHFSRGSHNYGIVTPNCHSSVNVASFHNLWPQKQDHMSLFLVHSSHILRAILKCLSI